MATFTAQLDTDFDKVFINKNEFARSVIYRSKDDFLTDITLDCIFNNAYEDVDIGNNLIASADPHIYFRVAALTVTPQIGDEVVIDSIEYLVSNIQEDSSGGVVLFLTEKDEFVKTE